MKKLIASLILMATLSSCATLFYDSPPTFQKAPVACVLDVFFGFAIIPLAVDTFYGSCKIEGLKK
jgi:hypothetical protein